MTILVIADDQIAVARVREVRADVVISCGDLPDELILQVADRIGCSCVLAVKGNHDADTHFHPSIVNLHLDTHDVSGVTFGGFQGCWRYKPRGHFLYTQAEVSEALSSFPRVDVFVAHNAPRLVHEKDDDIHMGFTAFNTYIDRACPRFFLHGHQHVNAESTVGSTKVIGTNGYRCLVVEQ